VLFVLQAEIEKVQKRREEREAEKERMEEELVGNSCWLYVCLF
jgi:hypothetical protein